jgi:outer membrane protein assembly factor BamB
MYRKLIFGTFALLLLSCSKDEVLPLGKINLNVDVLSYELHGIYELGVELDDSNYVILDVEIFQPTGDYYVSTKEINGIKFIGEGSLSQGVSEIKLQGVGVPTSHGSTYFEITTNSSNEEITKIPVYIFENLNDQIIFSSVQFQGDNSYYTIAQSERGDVLWKVEGYSMCAVVDNNIIYLANSNALIAINISDGSEIWSNADFADMVGMNLLNNSLYVVSNEGVYHKINAATSVLHWSYTPEVNDYPQSAPVLTESLLFVEDNGVLHALHLNNGSIVWSVRTGKLSGTSILMGDTLVTGSQDYIQALNTTDGSLIWKNNESVSSDLLLIQKKVYFFPNYISIKGIDINSGSTELFFEEFGDFSVVWSPFRFENSVIVVQSRFSGLTAWSIETSDSEWIWSKGTVTYSEGPPIVQDDIIYFGSLKYFSAVSGDLLLYSLSNDVEVNDVMLAIKNKATGEISYPTKSGMD